MLTKAQIDAAEALLENGKLSAVAQLQWVTLIRSYQRYQQQPGLYPSLEAKLAGATGLTAQVLQAALTEIEAIGSGEETLESGSAGGINWSGSANRTEFISDGFNALYGIPARRPSSKVVRDEGICIAHSRFGCNCKSTGRLLIF